MSIIIIITMRVMKHHMDQSIEPQVCKIEHLTMQSAFTNA